MTLDNGSVYDGEWKNNLMNGYGTFTWADGKSYSGGFLNGKMHG